MPLPYSHYKPLYTESKKFSLESGLFLRTAPDGAALQNKQNFPVVNSYLKIPLCHLIANINADNPAYKISDNRAQGKKVSAPQKGNRAADYRA